MQKNLFISSFRKLERLPLGFFGGIFLALIVHAVIIHVPLFWEFCYFYSDPPEDDGIKMEAQLRTMPKKKDSTRVFLIGSSQVREGFDVNYLNNKLRSDGLKFYNLGMAGAQPIQTYMLKDRLMEMDPDIIVYMVFVGSFYDKYDFFRMKQCFDPGAMPFFKKYIRKEEMNANKDIFFDSYVGYLSIFYKYRFSFDGIIKNYIKNISGLEERNEVKKYAFQEDKSEAAIAGRIKKIKKRRREGVEKFKIGRYTEFNKELFELFSKDVIDKGVKLVVMYGPTHPMIKELYSSDLDTDCDVFLSENSKELGYVYLSKDKFSIFEKEDFIDFTHLNDRGRNKFSKAIKTFFRKNEHLLK